MSDSPSNEPRPALPYRIAVLCYLFDDAGRLLLLHRAKPPNPGMYSPIGGKLDFETGEGPHGCALREIREETGVALDDDDIRLTGIVSEQAYQHESHWLIFLFEVARPVAPEEIAEMDFAEGRLEWVPVDEVANRNIPETDREIMWPLVQRHRGGFFMVHIDCRERPIQWRVQESIPAPDPAAR